MKNTISLFILLLAPALTLAKSKTSTELVVPERSSLTERPWSFGLVYEQQTDQSDEESLGLTGLNVQASRTFHMTGNFYTTSRISSNNLDGSNSLDDFDNESEYNGLQFTQQFSYLFKNFKYPIRPFIGFGIGNGNYSSQNRITNSQVRSEFGINSINISSKYQMSSTVIGIETLLDYNLAPFISYTTTRISYRDVKSKVDKNLDSFDIINVDADLESISGSRLTLGLNYRF